MNHLSWSNVLRKRKEEPVKFSINQSELQDALAVDVYKRQANTRLREKYHIEIREWAAQLMANSSHSTFCAITPYSVTGFFSCNKSNTTVKAVLLRW